MSKRGGIGEGYFSASILYGCNVCRHGACSPMRSCALWTRQDNVPKAVEAGIGQNFLGDAVVIKREMSDGISSTEKKGVDEIDATVHL